jgi:hypothetical protein
VGNAGLEWAASASGTGSGILIAALGMLAMHFGYEKAA